ncbi:MAG: hypothetical protein IT280_13240 [Ignavibacteria bacterium]|nr:hypothetical protein [Ignavibacteria bacterium]
MNLYIELLNLYSLHNRRKEADLLYKAKFKELEPIIREEIKKGAILKFGEDCEFLIDKSNNVIFRKVSK